MARGHWAAVDDYISDRLVPSEPALDAALRDSRDAGLPSINVTPAQGQLLHVLARANAARSVLEIGTLGGYSTIWLARALPPDGRLITLEAEPTHARVAQANIARAGFADLVDVRVGRALETLPGLRDEGTAPFDLVFIDADKPNAAEYFAWSLELARPGATVIVDNVVRNGAVLDADSVDPAVRGARHLHDVVATESRVAATTIQTVGPKGHDGFLIAVVTG